MESVLMLLGLLLALSLSNLSAAKATNRVNAKQKVFGVEIDKFLGFLFTKNEVRLAEFEEATRFFRLRV